MDFATFAERVKEARKKAGLSQAELAEKLGVGQNTVSNYENATGEKGSAPKLETAARIADVLNVSLDWLVGRDNAESKADITGKEFLNHLIALLKNPRYDSFLNEDDEASYTRAIKLAGRFDENGAPGFTVSVNGQTAGELNKKLENLLTIRERLKDGEVPNETVEEVISNMQAKIVDGYGMIFDIPVGTNDVISKVADENHPF